MEGVRLSKTDYEIIERIQIAIKGLRKFSKLKGDNIFSKHNLK